LPAGVAAGTYTIKAVFNGSNNFVPSNDATHSLTIEAIPTVASIGSPTSSGVVSIGAAIGITVTFSQSVSLAGGNLIINLNDGGTVTITPFSNSTTASGTYTVAAGQNTSGLDATSIVLITGATLEDTDGVAVDLTIPAGHSLVNNVGIVIVTAPPVFGPITPPVVNDGNPLSFTVSATAPLINGSPAGLTYSLGAGSPSGLAINAQSGLVNWTPSEWNNQPPGQYPVTFIVTLNGLPQLSATATTTIAIGPSSTNQGSGIAARTSVAYAITQSAEYFSNFITSAYSKYLGRTPDASGMAYWINLMQNGLSDEHLEAGFIGSVEYIANHGGAGAGWVQGMYFNLLGRTPAPSEVQYWLSQLASGQSTADIAYGFAASQERESQRVQADYQQYLGRNASPTEVPYWVNVFLSGSSNEKVVAGFVSSQEYFSQHGNNIVDWLFADYHATLNRLPDMTGYQFWEGKLA
jgi:hypothetical protein